MSDLQLETTLTANAGPLNAALQSGAQGVQQYAQVAQSASKAQNDAVRAGTAGLEAYNKVQRNAQAEANQLKQAYRQLPMQITDMTTSLASGMPVWMVAIQQGGQIKDSFGGVGNMMGELTKAITPLRLGFTGLAATGVVVALAYNEGAAEADAYRLAMVLSGNASGATRSQMEAMAASIDKVVGTQAGAADAIAQVVSTGRVAAANIELVSTTAIRLQRETGAAVKDTVADFAALGKDPVAASKRLNDQYNYLTKAVYEQIKALEKRGQVEQAADLAQRTFAVAMNSRAAELEANLGSIERAWRGVKDLAAEAWDAMLGIGRKETPAQALAKAQKDLDFLNSPDRKSQDPIRDEQRRAAIKQRIEDLRQQVYQEGEVAAAQQSSADATRRHIATEKDREAAAKASQDAYQRFKEQMLEGLKATGQELTLGRELTESERLELQVKNDLAEAAKKVTGARLVELQAYAANRIEQQRLVQVQRDGAKALEELNKAQRQAGLEAFKEANATQAANEVMRQQIAAMGQTADEVGRLEQARISGQITLKQEMLDELERVGLTGLQTAALREQIAALKERMDLVGVKVARAEEVAYAEVMKRQAEAERKQDEQRREGIATSIAEGIASGTLSAKGAWDLFRKEVVRQFANTVLMPQIRPVVDQADSWIKQGLSVLGSWAFGGDSFADTTHSASGEMIRGRRAGGGNVDPWGAYLVGERGPEVLRMGPQGGSVIPNHELGGATQVQNITYNVPPGMSPAAFAGALEQNNRRLKAEMTSDMTRPGRPLQRAAARSGRF